MGLVYLLCDDGGGKTGDWDGLVVVLVNSLKGGQILNARVGI